MTIEEIWNKSLSKIEQKVGDRVFDLWFKPIKIISLKEQTITLEIPNRFYREWIEDTYPNLIKESLEAVIGYTAILKFKIEEQQDISQKKNIEKLEHKRQRLANRGIYLNPKYTFDNFIKGASNQFAHAAALAVTEAPGKIYNPLFIYGGAGLGKTHLMNAIGNRVLETRHDVSILYAPTDQFITEVVTALRHDKMAELKEKYRNLDLFLLDDVQFITGKERTQEEFFHTFNALYEKQKQIIISCDRSPKEISDITDRLRSRFTMGLIADIQIPDIETKIAIIQKKADMMNIRSLPLEVVHFLADKIKSNVRELEGGLIRIAAQASLTGEEITIESTKKMLKDIIQDEQKPITVDLVLRAVCDFYNLKPADIKAKRRTRDLVLARHVTMYISKQTTESSLSDIGKACGGKDHATVIYACKQIEERRSKDETFNRMIENLLQKIKN
jgi:chromosomal replication initiator protein